MRLSGSCAGILVSLLVLSACAGSGDEKRGPAGPASGGWVPGGNGGTSGSAPASHGAGGGWDGGHGGRAGEEGIPSAGVASQGGSGSLAGAAGSDAGQGGLHHRGGGGARSQAGAGTAGAGEPALAGAGPGGCARAEDCPAIETREAECYEPRCERSTGACSYVAVDADGDGFATNRCQSTTPGVLVSQGSDCDDLDPEINPAAWDGPEDENHENGCGDGLDNDCNGGIDDARLEDGSTCTCSPNEIAPCAQTASGLEVTFPALDDQERPLGACRLGSRTCFSNGTWGECTGTIGPQPETCDGNDNDCDGIPSTEDPNTPKTPYVCDGDRDNRVAPDADTREACIEPPAEDCHEGEGQWLANPGGVADDCDDADATVFAGAPEICDHVDNDCDELVDDAALDAPVWSYDADGDYYRRDDYAPVEQCFAPNEAPQGCATLQTSCPEDAWRGSATPLPAGDCDDDEDGVNPSVTRDLCDGVDYNCDGSTETGCVCTGSGTRSCDAHPEDGTGICTAGTQQCLAGEWSACTGAQGPTQEVCGTEDRDCDGTPGDQDPDASDRSLWYCDADGDGHFSDTALTQEACLKPSAGCSGDWVVSPPSAMFDDCDDANAQVNPDVHERCDGVDEDCSSGGGVDAAEDADGDEHARPEADCDGGFPKDDCHDGDSDVFGGQTEFFTERYCLTGPVCWNSGEGYFCHPDCEYVSGEVQWPSWDYDCDGEVQRNTTGNPEITQACSEACTGLWPNGAADAECGSATYLQTCQSLPGGCQFLPPNEGDTQVGCR